jgi:hypothetical protein
MQKKDRWERWVWGYGGGSRSRPKIHHLSIAPCLRLVMGEGRWGTSRTVGRVLHENYSRATLKNITKLN